MGLGGGVGPWGVSAGLSWLGWGGGGCFGSLHFFISLKCFVFPSCPDLVHGVASCGPLLSPWPVWHCGYAILWLCCPCCTDVVGSHFLFWCRYGSSFLCAVSWPLRAGLLHWHVCHFLYTWGLDVWFFRTLDLLPSLLLVGLLCIIWTFSALTAGFPFFQFGLILCQSIGRFVPFYLLRRVRHPLSALFLALYCYLLMVCSLSCPGVDSVISRCFVLGVSSSVAVILSSLLPYGWLIDGLLP